MRTAQILLGAAALFLLARPVLAENSPSGTVNLQVGTGIAYHTFPVDEGFAGAVRAVYNSRLGFNIQGLWTPTGHLGVGLETGLWSLPVQLTDTHSFIFVDVPLRLLGYLRAGDQVPFLQPYFGFLAMGFQSHADDQTNTIGLANWELGARADFGGAFVEAGYCFSDHDHLKLALGYEGFVEF